MVDGKVKTNSWSQSESESERAYVIGYRPEPGWSNRGQDETWVKLSGGPNRPMLKNRRMSCG